MYAPSLAGPMTHHREMELFRTEFYFKKSHWLTTDSLSDCPPGTVFFFCQCPPCSTFNTHWKVRRTRRTKAYRTNTVQVHSPRYTCTRMFEHWMDEEESMFVHVDCMGNEEDVCVIISSANRDRWMQTRQTTMVGDCQGANYGGKSDVDNWMQVHCRASGAVLLAHSVRRWTYGCIGRKVHKRAAATDAVRLLSVARLLLWSHLHCTNFETLYNRESLYKFETCLRLVFSKQ